MKVMKIMDGGSERECAKRMYDIQLGSIRLTYEDYEVSEVAARYGVHRGTAYRGIRRGAPMYPDAKRIGDGPRPRLIVSRDAVEECDARRIAFYKTTPSWLHLDGLGFKKPPPRRSAQAILGTLQDLPQRQQPGLV